MQGRAIIFQGDPHAPWAAVLRRLDPANTLLEVTSDLGATMAVLERLSDQQAVAVVIGPQTPSPLAQARKLARLRPNLSFMIVVRPEQEAALRREAVFAGPPGGRLSIAVESDPAIGSLLDNALSASEQQLKLRTTLQRMKQATAAALPVDSREYERLMKSDRYLASVLKNAQDAIVSVDETDAVVSWNKGAERLFNLTEVRARRIKPASLFHDPAVFSAALSAARRKEHCIAEFSFGDSAESRFAEATFDALDNDQGSVVIILRETTERRRVQDRLEKDSQQKDEFLAMLAHELRNPLAPIRNASQILNLLDLDDVRAKNAASIIFRQSAHMASLIDDLLDVARVTRGVVAIKSTQVSMADVVNEAVEQTRGAVESKHQRLLVQVREAAFTVMGDHKRLTQVLANLLNNSSKYTPEGGDISLGMRLESGKVVIEVKDSGMGMEPELIERVFDMFSQGKRASNRAEGGLGIGLALVKALVASHGGSVEAKSAGAGMGSTFTVRLPQGAAAQPPLSQNTDQLVGVFKAGNRLRLMVVDDNEDAARTLALLLESSGHAVDVEIDPRQALGKAETFAPDVFILDIGMPYMDGYELARRIRAMAMDPRPLLIALTGYGLSADRARARQAGFDHHLVKPLDTEELDGLLQGVLPAVRH